MVYEIFKDFRYENIVKRVSIKELNVPLAGIAAGLRVYPGTRLAKYITDGTITGGLLPESESLPYQPVFYLSPLLGSDVASLINHLVAGDSRFLVLSNPDEEGSYNYADDTVLSDLIRQGARGAYWDILHKNR